MNIQDAVDIYIDFKIVLNSDLEHLKKELKLLIDHGKHIYLWDTTFTQEEMLAWCIENDLYNYIWDYRIKDSRNYQCPDFVIDPNEKLVRMFNNQGIPGNVVRKL
jgi:Na+-transporting NADH:ubiquinone oxidoreductase subunit NqrF